MNGVAPRSSGCLSGFHESSMAAKGQDVTTGWLTDKSEMQC